MSFKISKPTLLPARGSTVQAALAPVEKLNAAVNMLGRVAGDPMQSAVRLGELFDAGLLRYNAEGLLVAGPALSGGDIATATFKNYLHNGDHRWAQRGDVLGTAAGSRFPVDRWRFASALNAISASRSGFLMGQRDVPGSPTFLQRLSIDTADPGATAYTVYFQRIENLRRFAGKKVTMSWYAKANAPREMSLEYILSYGTGGAATEYIYAPKKHQLTTSWQRFTQTTIMPSMVGKAHSYNDSHLNAHFWLAAGSDANFQLRSGGLGNTPGIVDIACLQLEDGDTATDFEFLPDALTRVQCQRFYETSYTDGVVPGTAAAPNGRVSLYIAGSATGLLGQRDVRFKVSKRAATAITIYNDFNGAAGNVGQDDGSNVAATVLGVGTEGFYLQWSNTASRYGASFHFTADADWP